jgi:hypothetical protein
MKTLDSHTVDISILSQRKNSTRNDDTDLVEFFPCLISRRSVLALLVIGFPFSPAKKKEEGRNF